MVVDLPTPGAPVMPTRRAAPVWGRRRCTSWRADLWWSGRFDSMSVIARASTARSPARTPQANGAMSSAARGRLMRTKTLAAIIISTQTLCGIAVSRAADILWEVENPYRFFKRTSSFEMQERAFNAVRGAPAQPLPTNILWKVERRLNDPDCKDSSTPDNCLATARPGFEKSRLGWAAQTVDLNADCP